MSLVRAWLLAIIHVAKKVLRILVQAVAEEMDSPVHESSMDSAVMGTSGSAPFSVNSGLYPTAQSAQLGWPDPCVPLTVSKPDSTAITVPVAPHSRLSVDRLKRGFNDADRIARSI